MTSPDTERQNPIDPRLWLDSPYAIVATADVISYIRDPQGDDPELRSQVGAPADAVVVRCDPPGMDTDLITWSCHVCGVERADRFISVAPRPALFSGGIPDQKYNVRYCNDREACTTVATTAPVWPPEGVVAGYCVPDQELHANPHRGCVLR